MLHQIAKRFPDVEWRINKNLNLATDNCDIADAITVVLGYKGKMGLWKDDQQDISKLVQFLTYIYSFQKMNRDFTKRKKSGTLSQDEINQARKQYMLEEFKIQDYLNVNIDQFNK